MGVRTVRAALAIVGALALLAGCSGYTYAELPAEDSAVEADELVTFADDEYVPVLRTEHYSSLGQLAGDSTLVAVVHVDPEHEVRPDATGVRDVPVVLAEVLRGEHAEAEAVVVRTDVAAPGGDGRALLETGLDFLVFLAPFENADGLVDGVWVVVGHLAGVLQRTEDGTFHVIDPESSLVQGAFTRKQVLAQVTDG